MKLNKMRGFTLIELLVVLVLISLLAGFGRAKIVPKSWIIKN